MEILIGLIVWLAFGVLGAMIMSGKDRTGCGGWTMNESRAESEAEAHVCRRRIPRRR